MDMQIQAWMDIGHADTGMGGHMLKLQLAKTLMSSKSWSSVQQVL